jgi:hypothetical protein
MLGSQNAHKGGYYGRNFKPDETQDLEAASGGLSDEVALLRVMIRRVVELATGGGSSGDLEKAIAALNTLGTAATRLANLLKTEKKLAAGDSEMSKALNKALDDVLAELRGNKP